LRLFSTIRRKLYNHRVVDSYGATVLPPPRRIEPPVSDTGYRALSEAEILRRFAQNFRFAHGTIFPDDRLDNYET